MSEISGTEVIDLSYTVPAATLIERTDNYEEVKFDGIIKQVIIVIPPGSEDLVTVKVGVDEFDRIAFANKEGNFNFSVNYPVKHGSRIWAEIENADNTYSHGIAITLIVEKFVSTLEVE